MATRLNSTDTELFHYCRKSYWTVLVYTLAWVQDWARELIFLRTSQPSSFTPVTGVSVREQTHTAHTKTFGASVLYILILFSVFAVVNLGFCFYGLFHVIFLYTLLLTSLQTMVAFSPKLFPSCTYRFCH